MNRNKILATLRRVTPDDGHYFFGYYDKSPWSYDGKKILAGKAQFMDRRPTKADILELGWFDLTKTGPVFEVFGTSKAWNWQQGCMLQWLPDGKIIYNDRNEDNNPVSIIYDPAVNSTKILQKPVYTLFPGGKRALYLNFARLYRIRPGYGYADFADSTLNDLKPADCGIYSLDLESGENSLLISIEQLAGMVENEEEEQDSLHWVNHIEVNPEGSRFVFLHRWKIPSPKGGVFWKTRLISADPAGKDLRIINHGMVSHYDWYDSGHILAWAGRPEIGDRYFMFADSAEQEPEIIGDGFFSSDGHCSFSPDRRYMLTDTYPNAEGKRTLLLWDMPAETLIDLGKYYSPNPKDIDIRCDLHPRWKRNGGEICFDSIHDGKRSIYTLSLSE